MNLNEAYNLVADTVIEWMRGLIAMLPNILVAAIVLVIGIFIAKKIKLLAARLINKVSRNQTLNSIFITIVYFFFIGIVVFIVLSLLKLDKAVVSILAGAGILGLALALAFQDIAANMMAGIYISVRKPLKVGDIVKLSSYMGKVEAVNLRDTVIRTFQGQLVIIPNKDSIDNPIENYTLLGKRRFDLVVGVSYGDDLEKVKRVALEAVKDIEGLSPNEDISSYFFEFGDSSINLKVGLWVDSTEQSVYNRVGSQAIENIKKAFEENDIAIPFPVRTMDFGIKGGIPLRNMLDKEER